MPRIAERPGEAATGEARVAPHRLVERARRAGVVAADERLEDDQAVVDGGPRVPAVTHEPQAAAHRPVTHAQPGVAHEHVDGERLQAGDHTIAAGAAPRASWTIRRVLPPSAAEMNSSRKRATSSARDQAGQQRGDELGGVVERRPGHVVGVVEHQAAALHVVVEVVGVGVRGHAEHRGVEHHGRVVGDQVVGHRQPFERRERRVLGDAGPAGEVAVIERVQRDDDVEVGVGQRVEHGVDVHRFGGAERRRVEDEAAAAQLAVRGVDARRAWPARSCGRAAGRRAACRSAARGRGGRRTTRRTARPCACHRRSPSRSRGACASPGPARSGALRRCPPPPARTA